MERRVAVTGLGIISPVGNDVQTYWDSLVSGKCGIDVIRSFPLDDLPVKVAGEVKDFEPSAYGIEPAFARKQDRFTLFAVAAAAQAMSQSGLKASDEDGNILIGPADQIAVDDGGIVRPLAHHTAGGEGIGLALVLGDGVVVHHGIHIAAGHQKAQPRIAQRIDGLGILPIRLGDDADGIAVAFQNAADDGVTERGVIHIGVTDHIHKVAAGPTALFHILF